MTDIWTAVLFVVSLWSGYWYRWYFEHPDRLDVQRWRLLYRLRSAGYSVRFHPHAEGLPQSIHVTCPGRNEAFTGLTIDVCLAQAINWMERRQDG